MQEIVLDYVVLFILLELFEVQWQKANTLIGMLARMYHQYQKSIFIFLLLHPTFYFAIAFMILTNYNHYALLLFGIKMIDIGAKLVMMKQVFIDKEMTQEMSLMLLSPLHWSLPYLGLTIYPFLVYFALV